jgi:hypothetical protein
MSDANTPSLLERFWPALLVGIVVLASQAEERLVQGLAGSHKDSCLVILRQGPLGWLLRIEQKRWGGCLLVAF